MVKQKLYLGVAQPGQPISIIKSVRMDEITKDEAIELFSELIDQAYEDYESEGNDEYYD